LNWRGDQVVEAVKNNVSQALVVFGLTAEGYAKKELQKGHGVVTGTARRSIHLAEPGYNWRGDDVVPSKSSPNRGGQMVSISGLRLQIGSGLCYALALHQGHGGFPGYHFLTIGVRHAKPQMPQILLRYQLRRR
jgi:hypothetical protein